MFAQTASPDLLNDLQYGALTSKQSSTASVIDTTSSIIQDDVVIKPESPADISGSQDTLGEQTSENTTFSTKQPAPMPSTPARARPLIKLSAGLLGTYNRINEKYYATKKEQRRKKQRYASKPKTCGQGVVQDKKTAVDANHNYVLQSKERLNGRYTVIDYVGRGAFGVVVRAYDERAGECVAIKIVKNKRAFYQQAQTEIRLLNALAASGGERFNIVEKQDQFVHNGHQCIVFELLSMNLFELLKCNNFKGCRLNLIRKFAKDIASALGFLSSQHGPAGKNIIHCDLKPENVLLKHRERSAVKVVDFGSACFSNERMHTYIQSRFYRAPEVLLQLSYGAAIDMWSLGCILAEMFTGRPLFDGENETDQILKQVAVLGLPPSFMLKLSPRADRYFERETSSAGDTWRVRQRFQSSVKARTLRQAIGRTWTNTPQCLAFEDLVLKMLDFNPKTRISPTEALNHPFVTGCESSMGSTRGCRASASVSVLAGSERACESCRESCTTEALFCCPTRQAPGVVTPSAPGAVAASSTPSSRTTSRGYSSSDDFHRHFTTQPMHLGEQGPGTGTQKCACACCCSKQGKQAMQLSSSGMRPRRADDANKPLQVSQEVQTTSPRRRTRASGKQQKVMDLSN